MPNSSKQTAVLTVRVPNALHAEIESLAAKANAKRSEVMVDLLSGGVESARVEVDWAKFDSTVQKLSREVPLARALKEARVALGL